MKPAIGKAAWLLLASSIVAATASAASSAGVAVSGEDFARSLPPAGAVVEGYVNAGYRLEVMTDGAVEVASELAAVDSRAPFVMPEEPSKPTPVDRLARSLTVGARTEYEAVSKILGWMARHLDYDLDRGQSQEPDAVLTRRSAYCTGIARLAVALIRAVGIESREVAGYVVDGGGARGTPGDARRSGFHRWIEVRLPDRGWIFSDPLHSHHYVPASYLRLASEEVTTSAGVEGLLLERRDRRAPVDLFPAAPAGVTARRNLDRQHAAALRVRVEDQGVGTAILEGEHHRFVHALSNGVATFVGLDPGRYTLRLVLPGLPAFERAVELDGPVRTALFFPAPKPPSPSAARPGSPALRKGSP